MIIYSRQVCFQPIHAVTIKEENTHCQKKKTMPTVITQLQNNRIQPLKCCMNSLCTPVVVQSKLLKFRQESMSLLVISPEIDAKQFYKPLL